MRILIARYVLYIFLKMTITRIAVEGTVSWQTVGFSVSQH